MAHALEILESTATGCFWQDVRTAELGQALAFIDRHLVRPTLARLLRMALDVYDPMQRATAVRQAYKAIVRAV